MATKKKATTTKKASTTTRKTVSTKKTTVSAAAVVKKNSHPSFSESIRQLSFWRSLSAELVGTFLLAAVFIVGQGQPLYLLFAIAGLILVLGTVSGAYLNPATTVAAWVSRRISWLRALGYIVFQVGGALLAFVVINAFVAGANGGDTSAAYGVTEIFKANELKSGKELYVLFAELLGTLVFGFAVANALRTQDRLTSALTSGIGYFVALMIAFIAASYVGGTAILNPAVATAASSITFNLWPIAVYVLAPVVGAIAGFFLNDFLKGRSQ